MSALSDLIMTRVVALTPQQAMKADRAINYYLVANGPETFTDADSNVWTFKAMGEEPWWAAYPPDQSPKHTLRSQ